MTDYGKRAAWRNIGFNCFKYGLAVLIVVWLTGLVLEYEASMWGMFFGLEFTSLALIGLPVVLMFITGFVSSDVRDCSPVSELAIVFLALTGFALPLTAGGLLILAITSSDYEGVDKWLPNAKDRGHYELLEIQNAVFELELSEEVKKEMHEKLEEMRDKGILSGRDFGSMLGGLIYIVARDKGEPRTLDEISEVVRKEKRDIGKAYRYIGRELNIRILPPSPEQFIDRFSARLGLSQEVSDRAEKLVQEAKEEDIISGKSSKGIAAASIYISAHSEGEPRSLNEMSNILNITTVTIRERAKDLTEHLELDDVPENLQK